MHPPTVDSGSAAAMVWVKRFEVLMLLLAYILTFAIVLIFSVISKGTSLFLMTQVGVLMYPVYPVKPPKTPQFFINFRSQLRAVSCHFAIKTGKWQTSPKIT